MAQLYSIVTPNLTGTKLSLDSLYELALKGEYIVQSNFNTNHFKPRIRKLVEERKITQELPCYNLRNSWITLMIKQGIDIATVAKLVGTSENMIIKNYWGSDDSMVLPII